MSEHPTLEHCDDLNVGIAEYVAHGYRLDMIVPADSPVAAELSRGAQTVRLVRTAIEQPRTLTTDRWITGRAGMEYRDLLPDRLGGRLIASHIRLTKGGEVPDYVHYHKVRFQMIYCVSGAIKVVYEDQGPPFWLLPGDCVLQPPEIRHRVLEAEAGSEVIELGVPAVHQTWVEHDIQLPTVTHNPGRDFGGQRFVRHVATQAGWEDSGFNGCRSRNTTIAAATSGAADVKVFRINDADACPLASTFADCHLFLYVLDGAANAETNDQLAALPAGSAMIVSPGANFRLSSRSATILTVALKDI